MKTKCTYCGKMLSTTKSKNVFAYNGMLYCKQGCAVEHASNVVKLNGEYVDKSILKGEE